MIIIPARLNSSRFENKILADILGLPMVIRTAKQVQDIDDVTIATDSQEVVDLATSHNIKAVLTSTEHQSGTDRINEAASILCPTAHSVKRK
jgi:3-deoxy-manno-octulosonate cytidylyltransferase (CMP-KDO synthetase)